MSYLRKIFMDKDDIAVVLAILFAHIVIWLMFYVICEFLFSLFLK